MSRSQALHNGIFKELLPPNLFTRIEPIEACAVREAHPTLGVGHDLFGDGTYLAVALPGHADGHFGLLWQTDAGLMLYATDSAWTMAALREDKTPELPRTIVFHDRRAGRNTEAKLRAFMNAGGQVQLCHDWESG